MQIEAVTGTKPDLSNLATTYTMVTQNVSTGQDRYDGRVNREITNKEMPAFFAEVFSPLVTFL